MKRYPKPVGSGGGGLASTPVVAPQRIEELVFAKRYGVQYQPVVCRRSGEVFGYEALARFYLADGRTIAPDRVFEALHEDPLLLCQVEHDLKRLQLQQAPDGARLFINLDPHAVGWASNAREDPLLAMLARHPGVVVELIENIDIHDARAALRLQRQLRRLGIATALDDVGAPRAMLSLDVLGAVDYLKLDRRWLHRSCDGREAQLLDALLAFARRAGLTIVAEGVEHADMLAATAGWGADYVQGYLYRDRFIDVCP